jgi:carboxypeptidase Taq
MASTTSYNDYKERMQKIADVNFASAVLQWDQETYLPAKGAAFRGRQLSTLSEIAHQQFTDPSMKALLEQLLSSNHLSEEERKNVLVTHMDYDRRSKLTSGFVRELTETINRSFHAWINARRENRFAVFAPELAKLIELKKQEAEAVGYQDHPYNAFLDEFDKGSTIHTIASLFEQVSPALKQLLSRIQSRPQIDDSFLKRHFPKDLQWKFGLQLIEALGFDTKAGRQDVSEHPFTINFNRNDVRVTTRIDENDLSNMVWSCIHETGHALYEQGLPETGYGLPAGEASSLTIHESQSRFWENHIGRSREFCAKWLPVLKEYFPEQLRDVSIGRFYQAINKVEPSFIRTEADELTYHFHVMIRFELEKALFDNTIGTEEIPEYWNSAYRKYLGVEVPDDKRGCLQDVHWSHGSFGYFPTYSLGSFHAAAYFAAMKSDLPDAEVAVSSGNYQGILEWLRNHIHPLGRIYTSTEVCRKVTGNDLQVNSFLKYVMEKYEEIYNL